MKQANLQSLSMTEHQVHHRSNEREKLAAKLFFTAKGSMQGVGSARGPCILCMSIYECREKSV